WVNLALAVSGEVVMDIPLDQWEGTLRRPYNKAGRTLQQHIKISLYRSRGGLVRSNLQKNWSCAAGAGRATNRPLRIARSPAFRAQPAPLPSPCRKPPP